MYCTDVFLVSSFGCIKQKICTLSGGPAFIYPSAEPTGEPEAEGAAGSRRGGAAGAAVAVATGARAMAAAGPRAGGWARGGARRRGGRRRRRRRRRRGGGMDAGARGCWRGGNSALPPAPAAAPRCLGGARWLRLAGPWHQMWEECPPGRAAPARRGAVAAHGGTRLPEMAPAGQQRPPVLVPGGGGCCW